MVFYVDLAEYLPVEERELIRSKMRARRRTGSSYLTEHPWVGKRIWRPVDRMVFLGKLFKDLSEDLLIRPSTAPSGGRSWFLRADRKDPEKWIAADADATGHIICICYEQTIPDGWTYFEVKKVHHLETSLIVVPIVGDRQELLQLF